MMVSWQNGKKDSNGFPLHFPLREKQDYLLFSLMLVILPLFINFNCYVFCEWTLFPPSRFPTIDPGAIFYPRALINTALLAAVLLLAWIPLIMAVLKLPDFLEKIIVRIRNLALIFGFFWFFPHMLVRELILGNNNDLLPNTVYYGIWAFLGILYVAFTIRKIRHTSYEELRSGKPPRRGFVSKQLLFYDTVTFFIMMGLVVMIQASMLANTPEEKLELGSYTFFLRFPHDTHTTSEHSHDLIWNVNLNTQKKPQTRQSLQAQPNLKIAWGFGSFFCGIVFFLLAVLPNRLMSSILLPVSFHEKDWIGLLRKSYRYAWQFTLALAYNNPLVYVGGIFISGLYLVTPIILVYTKQSAFLELILEPDLTVLGAVIFFSWFTPVALAVIRPEHTFGESFNRRVAGHLMMVRGHIVLFGFGSLGKRVLDREMERLTTKPEYIFWKRWLGIGTRYFKYIVTPDLRLEKFCVSAVIVERHPNDILFSATDPLLGKYGVVGTFYQDYRTRRADGALARGESRILVPVIIGEAQEHFISSRVNLERAKNIICTIPDGETVRSLFERCRRYEIPAIINVSRSDQIATLTYRARHRQIVLVYPQQNQGSTLGYQLWAAILKMRAIRFGKDSRQWPKVLIAGNSKANHYMIETLWSFLPRKSGYPEPEKILADSLALLVVEDDKEVQYAQLIQCDDPIFNYRWPAMSITSKRIYSKYQDDPKLYGWKTQLVNDLDQTIFEQCLDTHRPDIIVVNHHDFEMASILISRCLNSLERLKTRYGEEFRLPLLLLSTSDGEKAERRLLGDISRKYDALCRMHKEATGLDITYPAHTHKNMYGKDLIGESVIDCLDDAEEIINGARKSFEMILEAQQEERKKAKTTVEKEKAPKYVEISSCLPNRPGALPDYLAALARMNFTKPDFNDIHLQWELKVKKISDLKDTTVLTPMIPSIQFLRHIILNPEADHFALSGYAALIPLQKDSFLFTQKEDSVRRCYVRRIFANDGEHYIERSVDGKELYGKKNKKEVERQHETIPDPVMRVVPNVINRLVRKDFGDQKEPQSEVERQKRERMTVEQFVQNMLGGPGMEKKYACPGMINCRISAYQEYATAYNNLRIPVEHSPAKEEDQQLWHARNYFSSTCLRDAGDHELVTPESPQARIFVCCRSQDKPGMIARALNCLFYKTDFEYTMNKKNGNWVVNIDYFMDTTCRNSRFGLNRLFGVYHHQPEPDLFQKKVDFPINYIRILPYGGYDSFKQWYLYARVLHTYLNKRIMEIQESVKRENQFMFSWLDANRDGHHFSEDDKGENPRFLPDDRSTWPVVIFLERGKREQEGKPLTGKCHICQSANRKHDCSRFRAWV